MDRALLTANHLVTTMRTTLDIDDSVLAAIKELAQREGRSAGAVLSDMARQVLTQGAFGRAYGLGQIEGRAESVRETPAVYGFRPLPAGKEIVTNALVDKLRDEQGV
jgi:hypothetical protein